MVVAVRAVASLLLVAACLAAAYGSSAGQPGYTVSGAPSIPTSLARQPAAGEPLSGLGYRDAGTAKMVFAVAPASGALGGANDFLVVGSVVLAAGDAGLSLSVDGGTSWRPVLTGVQMWSLTAAAGRVRSRR
jgi:hypothetical protein